MSTSAYHKVWLITGCSTGIGRALAEAVLRHGDRLVATARNINSLDSLHSFATEEKQLLIVKLDVTKSSDVEEAFQQAIHHFGRVDVVVNNAGFGIFGEFESLSEENINQQLDVNFHGVLKVSRAAVRVFREVNKPLGGRLIQISSAAGFQGFPAASIYNASKFALDGFSEALSLELKPEWNIKVTIVLPGGFRTDFVHRSLVLTTPTPAYEGSPASAMRHLVQVASGKEEGDPAKAAQAVITIAHHDNPPLRLPLGPDCVKVMRAKLNAVTADLDTWQDLANSTSFPGSHHLTPEDLGLKL